MRMNIRVGVRESEHVAKREVRVQIEVSRRVVANAVAMLFRLRGDRASIDPPAER